MNKSLQLSNQFFQQQWQIYQKVVANNYMNHREIYQVFYDFINQNFTYPFSLLDLGCGDAGVILKSLLNTSINFYHGVDLSEEALKIAEANFASVDFKYTLTLDNIVDFVNNNKSKNSAKYDLIFTSFCVHHLSLKDKEVFITNIPNLLKDKGMFIFIDVFRLPDETREDYLPRYTQNLEKHWELMTKQELSQLIEHITNNDFPETLSTIINLAQAAGFKNYQCLYQDPFLTSKLLCFWTDSN
jgi:cyclopropane fatty-acyl-phospholipid synthase-like methyltransferase